MAERGPGGRRVVLRENGKSCCVDRENKLLPFFSVFLVFGSGLGYISMANASMLTFCGDQGKPQYHVSLYICLCCLSVSLAFNVTGP